MVKAHCNLCGEDIELNDCSLKPEDDGYSIICSNGCNITGGRWDSIGDLKLK